MEINDRPSHLKITHELYGLVFTKHFQEYYGIYILQQFSEFDIVIPILWLMELMLSTV